MNVHTTRATRMGGSHLRSPMCVRFSMLAASRVKRLWRSLIAHAAVQWRVVSGSNVFEQMLWPKAIALFQYLSMSSSSLGVFLSTKAWCFWLSIHGTWFLLKVSELDTDVPLFLSRPVLAELGMRFACQHSFF